MPIAVRTEPAVFRHYLLERRADGSLWELGRGGMGVTYKAIDTNLECAVALKIIGPQCFGGERSRHRFIREARLAAQIRHPNVAAVHHLECEADEIFYAMEFVDGITAEDWVIRRGPMGVELALDVAMQVSRALTAANQLKLVHRDIKPGNIMVLADPADGTRVIVKVIDFGLARSLDSESTLTATTCAFVGTPQYASPEQVENLELDSRSDIYSLGCVLWFLLNGEPPFTGSNPRIMAKHLTSEPAFESLAQLPEVVTSLLRTMLAKDPTARPQSPVDLHARITGCRAALPRRKCSLRSVPIRRSGMVIPNPFNSFQVAGSWALALAATAWLAYALTTPPRDPSLSTASAEPAAQSAKTSRGARATTLPQPPTGGANATTNPPPVFVQLETPGPTPIHPPELDSLSSSIAARQSSFSPAESRGLEILPDSTNTVNSDPAETTLPSTTPAPQPPVKSRTKSRKPAADSHRSGPVDALQRSGHALRGFVSRIF
jgi:serine/threonine protein kinase